MNRLREYRQGLGLTLQEVGDRTGIPTSTVFKHETGAIELNAISIDKYRQLYGVRILELWMTRDQIRACLPGMVERWEAAEAKSCQELVTA